MTTLLALLATYRLSYDISCQHGPAGVYTAIRRYIPAANCIICVSFWIGIIMALLVHHKKTKPVVVALATSSLPAIIEHIRP